MTYAELVERVALNRGLTKKGTRETLEVFFMELAMAVWKHGRMAIPELAVFEVRRSKRKRVSVHPPGAHTRRKNFLVPSTFFVSARVAKSWRRK